MNIFWYLLILVFFECIEIYPLEHYRFLPPAFPAPMDSGKALNTTSCTRYDFDNNKKWRKVRAQHKEVSLQDIGQTFGCNMLKTVNLS